MGASFVGRFNVVPAVYVLFRKDDEVLLLKRFNTTYYDGCYSLPAGHIDGGEPAIIAAIREAKEEVGANLTEDELKLVHTLHRSSEQPSHHERIDLFFQTTLPHPEIINAEPEKCSELRWANLHDLPDDMVPEVSLVLERTTTGQTYSDYNFS